jgi:type IV secretory pathway TraG/TraD family ATPase VirD4
MEYLVKALGKETIYQKGTSLTRGRNRSSNVSENLIGRELLTLDEIRRLDRNKCILLVSGVKPFLSKKYNIKKHRKYRELYENNSNYIRLILNILRPFLTNKYILKLEQKAQELDSKNIFDYNSIKRLHIDLCKPQNKLNTTKKTAAQKNKSIQNNSDIEIEDFIKESNTVNRDEINFSDL